MSNQLDTQVSNIHQHLLSIPQINPGIDPDDQARLIEVHFRQIFQILGFEVDTPDMALIPKQLAHNFVSAYNYNNKETL